MFFHNMIRNDTLHKISDFYIIVTSAASQTKYQLNEKKKTFFTLGFVP